ncbi:MAG TPA: DUF6607 family protein [Cryomorphaceae bacterium]|nr:DUF6607 family protein [Cryomorphaceae bacterium]
MKNLTLILAMTVAVLSAHGQNAAKKDADRAAIRALAGCYKVTFDFAETFSPDTAYEFRDRYHSSGIEYVFVLTDEPDLIQLQHLLIINDSTIIKHWRQDWIYEETELLSYEGDRNWKTITYSPEEVKGTWTQKVYQVDDSPRYESKGTWVHVDGKHYWEGVANAPLPRREFTKRSDYNIVKRHSRIQLDGDGWYLEQDNEKINRTADGTDHLLVWEKGMESFTTGDYDCAPAIAWWEANKDYWSDVRLAWDEIFSDYPEMKFLRKVDNKLLWQQLYALAKEDISSEVERKDRVKELILKYMEV